MFGVQLTDDSAHDRLKSLPAGYGLVSRSPGLGLKTTILLHFSKKFVVEYNRRLQDGPQIASSAGQSLAGPRKRKRQGEHRDLASPGLPARLAERQPGML